MARPIFDLCDEYVTRAALLDPVWATMRGIGGSVGAATDFGPEGVAARAELIGEMLRRLARLEPSTEEDRAAADFLGDRLGAERDWYDSGEPLRLVRAPFGPIGTIRDSVDLLPRDSEEAWRAVTARLSAVPVMLASWRAALAVGLQRGLVGARRQAVESAAQADRYVGLDDAPPTHDAVVEAYGEGPLRAELAGAARAAHAAYAETARHLREDYGPRRPTVWAPSGTRWRAASSSAPTSTRSKHMTGAGRSCAASRRRSPRRPIEYGRTRAWLRRSRSSTRPSTSRAPTPTANGCRNSMTARSNSCTESTSTSPLRCAGSRSRSRSGRAPGRRTTLRRARTSRARAAPGGRWAAGTGSRCGAS